MTRWMSLIPGQVATAKPPGSYPEGPLQLITLSGEQIILQITEMIQETQTKCLLKVLITVSGVLGSKTALTIWRPRSCVVD